MSVITKISHQKSLDVCYICVDYLVNKCLREKGLFRNPPSVVEIRKLRTLMLDERQANSLKESTLDPHLVAGVLQLTLKDMAMSVFHKIYDDMMGSVNESPDFTRNKLDVVQWMCRFDADSFNFVKTLMAFIHQLGTTPGNESNISQLVFIFAPLLCRPANSAYMSVRHMEDLRKLRPTLQVIVENYLEIFSEARPCVSDETDAVVVNPRSLQSDMEAYSTDSKGPAGGEHVAFSPTKGSMLKEVLLPSGVDRKKIALNLQVAVTPPASDVNDPTLSTVAVRQVNYQSKEWNRLEQMVFSMSESFLSEPFKFFNPNKSDLACEPSSGDGGMIISNENDLMACTIETFDAGNIGFGGGEMDSPSRDLGETDEGRYWTDTNTGTGDLFLRNSGGRVPTSPLCQTHTEGAACRASNRRKMVHDCRALRQQISKFEKDFVSEHDRQPKGPEKGHMQATYAKYRDMKREIRSSAAVDIQRLIRGFTSRAKLRKKNKFVPLSPSRFARSPPRPSSSPSRGSRLQDMMFSGGNRPAGSLEREFEQNSVDSTLWKSGRESADYEVQPGASAGETAEAKALYAKYKDLLLQKRTLKRRLKRFDEEFAAKHNRQPKKTDKEVMRPHYQKYHEVRNEMQALKAKIEKEMGSLPLELQEAPEGEAHSHHQGHHHPHRPHSEPSSDSGGRPSRGGQERMEESSSTPSLPTMNDGDNRGGEDDEELLTRYESQQQQQGAESGRGGLTVDSSSGNGHSTGWVSASPTVADGHRSHGAGGHNAGNSSSSSGEAAGWSRASSSNPADMEALQKEKRQLHIVLKAYERDFNQIHGRHVMKPEDIAPVAGEYQRYKELKKKLKDM